MQPFPIGGERGRKRIKGNVFATVGPDRIAGDLRQHLKTVNDLHDATGLETLARIRETWPAVLVTGKAASRELAIEIDHVAIIPLGGLEMFGIVRLQVEHCRLAKSLRDVDIVPVN